jgi:hypothetical protein
MNRAYALLWKLRFGCRWLTEARPECALQPPFGIEFRYDRGPRLKRDIRAGFANEPRVPGL